MEPAVGHSKLCVQMTTVQTASLDIDFWEHPVEMREKRE